MENLSSEDITEKLGGESSWSVKEGKLHAEFSFADFNQSMNFINKVAALAEDKKHHPDILIKYNKVTLWLWTHDTNGITDKDIELAKEVEDIRQ